MQEVQDQPSEALQAHSTEEPKTFLSLSGLDDLEKIYLNRNLIGPEAVAAYLIGKEVSIKYVPFYSSSESETIGGKVARVSGSMILLENCKVDGYRALGKDRPSIRLIDMSQAGIRLEVLE